MNEKIESELDFAIWNALERQYGLEGERLYRYILLRSQVAMARKGRTPANVGTAMEKHLTLFLLNEWGLREREMVFFQGQEIHIETNGQYGIHRIVGDWHTRYTSLYTKGNYETDVKKESESYIKEAKRSIQKWSKQPFYDIALKGRYLQELNRSYGIQSFYEGIFIDQLNTANEDFPHRLELQYERLLHPYFFNHTDASLVDEKTLEDYLALHLDDVEPGLSLIGRQVVLERGRIDLLARDQSGRMVIIEAKVASDTDLIWQQAYYTREVEKLYGGAVRFMVIAPKWEAHIMGLLLKTPDTEIKLFKPVVEQNRVQQMTFKSRNTA